MNDTYQVRMSEQVARAVVATVGTVHNTPPVRPQGSHSGRFQDFTLLRFLRKCDFGIKWMSLDSICLLPGELVIGLHVSRCPALGLTTTFKIPVGTTCYLGWEYAFSSKLATWQNFGATMSYDGAHVRRWLYKVQCVNLVSKDKNGADVNTPRLFLVGMGHFNGFAPGNFGEDS